MGKAIVINADFSANSFDHVTFDVIHATSITVTPSTLALNAIGATSQLSYTLIPADAQETVQFSSSNPDVATVTSDGLVTVTGCGTCTITATAGNVSDTCAVTVVIPMTTGYARAVCGTVDATTASNDLTSVTLYSTNKLYLTGYCAIFAIDETKTDLPLYYDWVDTSVSPNVYKTMEYIQSHNPWSQFAGWSVPIKLPSNCTRIRFRQLSADYAVYPLFYKYNQPSVNCGGLVVVRKQAPKISGSTLTYEMETVVDVPEGWDSFAATWCHKNGQDAGVFASMSEADLAKFTVEFL